MSTLDLFRVKNGLDVSVASTGQLTATLTTGSSHEGFRLAARNGAGTAVSTEQARFAMEYNGAQATGLSFIRGAGTTDASLAIITNGAERVRVDATGSVGIGVSAPSTPLHVYTAAAGTEARVQSGGAGARLRLQDSSGNVSLAASGNTLLVETGGTERARINTSGYLGINTTAATARLEVSDSAAKTQLRLHRSSGATNTSMGSVLLAGNNGSGTKTDYAAIEAFSNSVSAGSESGVLVFSTATGGALTESLRITESGRVGVNNSAPEGMLHVREGSNPGDLSLTGTAGSSVILLGNSDTSGAAGPVVLKSTNRTLAFGVGSSFSKGGGTFTEYVRVSATGNVGVGTASPSRGLHLAGGASSTVPGIRLERTGVRSWSAEVDDSGNFKLIDDTATTTRLSVSSAGLATWTGALTVSGTITGNVSGNATNVTGTVAVANGGTGSTTAAAARSTLGLAIGSNVQAWDADLDAIAALAGTSGLLKKTAANTWTLDTATYLTANQTITASGDATGSGTTAITLTLANSGVTAGTYAKVTVDAKGRVTAGAALASGDLPDLSSTYQPLKSVLTSVGNLATNVTGLVKLTNGVASLDSGSYLTANQTITVSGDASGSGTTSLALTLANSGVTAGTYAKVTVDAKGRVTAGSAMVAGDIPDLSATYQPKSTNLSSVSALSGASTGLMKLTNGVASLDSSVYLTANQTITVSGDASGSGTTTLALTLANSGVTAGTYRSVTVDAKGRVTAGTNPTTLAGYGITDALASSTRGAVNGVASLDASGKIPAAQLPSLADDVLEYTNLAAFPATGETGKLYVALDTNKLYRWSGTAYVVFAAGAVDSVAGKTGAVTLAKADVGLTNVDNTSDASKPVSTATQSALDLKANIASPTFTGTPAAPTATAGTNTTQLATTAFVTTAVSGKQDSDADLTAIAALAGTSGLLKKTAANTWSLDTSTYLTANQTVTVSGDATGSGTTSIALTLANSGVTAGTYNNSATQNTPLVVDAKGRITGVGTAVTITPAFSSITGKPTTLSGYGITDAVALTGTLPLAQGDFTSSTFSAATTSASQIIDSTASASYRTVKYLIQASTSSAYQASEVLVVHNGTTVQMVEYALIFTGAAALASYDVDISGGNIRLLATPANANTVFRVIKTMVDV